MIDLETMSTRNNAVILVIAGIKFDRNDEHVQLDNMDTFYKKIDIHSCKQIGMHICKQTMEWWQKQDREIRKEAFSSDNRTPIQQALIEFSQWFGDCNIIWSQGANFDIPILSDAYSRCEMEIPWKFWNARDTRTIYELAGIRHWDLPKMNGHHALYDCWRQVWGVKESIKRLKKMNL